MTKKKIEKKIEKKDGGIEENGGKNEKIVKNDEIVMDVMSIEEMEQEKINKAIGFLSRMNKNIYDSRIEIGKYILDNFYNGDVEYFRLHGSYKNISIEKIRKHSSIGMSKSWILDSIELYWQNKMVVNNENFKKISITHRIYLTKIDKNSIGLSTIEINKKKNEYIDIIVRDGLLEHDFYKLLVNDGFIVSKGTYKRENKSIGVPNIIESYNQDHSYENLSSLSEDELRKICMDRDWLHNAYKEEIEKNEYNLKKMVQLERQNNDLKMKSMTEREKIKCECSFIAEEMRQHVIPKNFYKDVSKNIKKVLNCNKVINGYNMNLALGDIHYGACFEPAEPWGLNFYSKEECEIRMNRLADGVVGAWERDHVSYGLNNLIIMGMGDMVDGEGIYPGHENYVDVSSADKQSFGVAEIMRKFIVRMLPYYEKIILYGVTGNHSRNGKPGERKSSWDYVAYNVLKFYFEQFKEVEIWPSESSVLIYETSDEKDKKIKCISHGNEVKSFGGCPQVALDRNTLKMYMMMSRAGVNIDYTVYGHFHEFGASDNMIINGSLVGGGPFSVKGSLKKNTLPYQVMFYDNAGSGWGNLSRIFVADQKQLMVDDNKLYTECSQ